MQMLQIVVSKNISGESRLLMNLERDETDSTTIEQQYI